MPKDSKKDKVQQTDSTVRYPVKCKPPLTYKVGSIVTVGSMILSACGSDRKIPQEQIDAVPTQPHVEENVPAAEIPIKTSIITAEPTEVVVPNEDYNYPQSAEFFRLNSGGSVAEVRATIETANQQGLEWMEALIRARLWVQKNDELSAQGEERMPPERVNDYFDDNFSFDYAIDEKTFGWTAVAKNNETGNYWIPQEEIAPEFEANILQLMPWQAESMDDFSLMELESPEGTRPVLTSDEQSGHLVVVFVNERGETTSWFNALSDEISTEGLAPIIQDPNLREMIGNAVPEKGADGGWVLRDGTGNIRFTYNEQENKWEGIAPGETTIVSSITGVEYNLVRSPFNLMALNQEGEKLLDYAWWLALTGNDILDRPPESVSDDELRQYFADHPTVDDFVYLKHSDNSNIDGKPEDTPHDVEAVEVNGPVNTKKVDILVWTNGEEGASMGRVVNFGDSREGGGYYVNIAEDEEISRVQLNLMTTHNIKNNPQICGFTDGMNCSLEEGYGEAGQVYAPLFTFSVDRSAIVNRGVQESGFVGGRIDYHFARAQAYQSIYYSDLTKSFLSSCIATVK